MVIKFTENKDPKFFTVLKVFNFLYFVSCHGNWLQFAKVLQVLYFGNFVEAYPQSNQIHGNPLDFLHPVVNCITKTLHITKNFKDYNSWIFYIFSIWL